MSSFGTNVGTLNVGLGADTAALDKGIAKATGKLQAFSDNAKSIAIASAAGFAAAGATIFKAIEAAGIQQAAELKLETALRNAGTGASAQVIKDLASSLQSVTTFGDEATLEMAALLSTYGLHQDTLTTLIPQIQDMSAAMGVDMKSAALLVGRAMAGQTSTLSRYGIVLSETQQEIFKTGTEAQKTAELTKLLGDRFGGTAKVLAQTASGALTQASNSFGDLWEQIGLLLDAPVGEFARGMKDAFDGVNETLANANPKLKEMVGEATFAATAILGVTSAVSAAGVALPFMAKGLTAIATALKAVSVAGLATAKALLPLLAIAGAAATLAGLVDILQTTGTAAGARDFEREAGVGPEAGLLERATATLGIAFQRGIDPLMSGLEGLFADLTSNMGESLARQERVVEKAAMAGGGQAAGIDFAGSEGVFADLKATADTLASSQFAGAGGLFGEDGIELDALGASASFAKEAERIEGVARALGDASEAAGTGAQALGAALLDGAPVARDGINAFAGAVAATGNPLAGVASVAVSLITKTETFQSVIGVLNSVLQGVVKVVNDLVKPLLPMVVQFGALASVMVQMMAPVVRLGSAIDLLGPVFDGVATIANAVGKWISTIWNFILDQMITLFQWLDDIPGIDTRGVLRTLRRSRISFDDIEDQTKEAARLADTMASSMTDFNEAAETFGGGLTNAPAGFRIALDRFNSINTGVQEPGATGSEASMTSLVIESLQVITDDVAGIAKEIQQEAAWQVFTQAPRSAPDHDLRARQVEALGLFAGAR